METNSVWLNGKNECDMTIYWTIVLIAKYILPAALEYTPSSYILHVVLSCAVNFYWSEDCQ